MIAPSTDDAVARLAAALVRLGEAAGVEAEGLRVRELVREAATCWPGEIEDQWWKWLSEAAKSLHLRTRIADLTTAEAVQLCHDGALLTTFDPQLAPEEPLVLSSENSQLKSESIGKGSESGSLQSFGQRATASGPDARHRWLILEAPELSQATSTPLNQAKPLKRYLAILKPEISDIWIVILFAFFVGLLSLATPLAVETLVNTVAFGRFLQPVIVLATLLCGFLAFGAAMLGLQTFVVEIIQRRLFARVAADLCHRLPRVRGDAFDKKHGPELVNRFFDVVTLQKVTADLLVDGVAIVLITFVGMSVLAFYHPWLLGFDILLLVMVTVGVVLLGRGAIQTSIEESKYKYRVAAWLQDLARCQTAFKLGGAGEFVVDRTNHWTGHYLGSRRDHFHVLLRQILFVLFLQAGAGTVLLGFGGWLVIQGQLTLGQLVAAELIVAVILGSLAKLGKHLEGYYDALAAVDKLGYLFDLPLEKQDGLLHQWSSEPFSIELTNVQCKVGGSAAFSHPVSATFSPGSIVAVTGEPGSGKSTLLDLLYGLRVPSAGHLEIDDADPHDMRPDLLRSEVTLVRENELFQGTLMENVHLHRPSIGHAQVRNALSDVGFLEDALRLNNGLETQVESGGVPLTSSQQIQVLLARAVVSDPRVLLIDGVLDGLPASLVNTFLENLKRNNVGVALIVTNRGDVIAQCDRVFSLSSDLERLTLPSGPENLARLEL